MVILYILNDKARVRKIFFIKIKSILFLVRSKLGSVTDGS